MAVTKRAGNFTFQGGSSHKSPLYYGSWVSDSKEAEFKPPGLAKIFFSDIQSVTLNYNTPRHIVFLHESYISPNGEKAAFKLCQSYRQRYIQHQNRHLQQLESHQWSPQSNLCVYKNCHFDQLLYSCWNVSIFKSEAKDPTCHLHLCDFLRRTILY